LGLVLHGANGVLLVVVAEQAGWEDLYMTCTYELKPYLFLKSDVILFI
jgi:hypothetical protein